MPKITSLGTLLGSALASGDKLVVVDVSDTSMGSTGTDKNISAGELASGISTLLGLGSAAFVSTGTLAANDSAAVVTAEAYADTKDLALISGGTALATALAALGYSLAEPLQFVVDNGASVLTTGAKKAYVRVPYKCTIVGWTILADVSGSIQLDIWKDTYGNYPPTVADTITASAKPTVTTAIKNTSTTLTGWTTTLNAADILELNVDSVTSIKKMQLFLHIVRAP